MKFNPSPQPSPPLRKYFGSSKGNGSIKVKLVRIQNFVNLWYSFR